MHTKKNNVRPTKEKRTLGRGRMRKDDRGGEGIR
jgi:hypothetical protein